MLKSQVREFIIIQSILKWVKQRVKFACDKKSSLPSQARLRKT